MVNPWLVQPHVFEASPETDLATICLRCGQWQYVKVHYAQLAADLADARAQLEGLHVWKSSQQAFLIRAAITLLEAGYRGEGVYEGIDYIARELADARAQIVALREQLDKP